MAAQRRLLHGSASVRVAFHLFNFVSVCAGVPAHLSPHVDVCPYDRTCTVQCDLNLWPLKSSTLNAWAESVPLGAFCGRTTLRYPHEINKSLVFCNSDRPWLRPFFIRFLVLYCDALLLRNAINSQMAAGIDAQMTSDQSERFSRVILGAQCEPNGLTKQEHRLKGSNGRWRTSQRPRRISLIIKVENEVAFSR